jgi:hypothetical protein
MYRSAFQDRQVLQAEANVIRGVISAFQVSIKPSSPYTMVYYLTTINAEIAKNAEQTDLLGDLCVNCHSWY